MTFRKTLSAALDACTPEDITDGAALYPEYHRRIRQLAIEYGFPFAAACGAFAALSPRLPINSNFRALVTCMHRLNEGHDPSTISAGTFKRQARAACLVLSGERDFSDVCKGPKITAFRDNLLKLDDSTRATIDGHMISIMLGRDLSMLQALYALREYGKGGTEPNYRRFERAFVSWAKTRGGAPATLQAILWHNRRRVKEGRLALGQDVPDIVEPYPLPKH